MPGLLPPTGSVVTLADPGVVVAGVRISSGTEAELIRRVRGSWHDGGWILTANVDVLRAMSREPGLHGLGSSAVVVADGMPVVWAARLAGEHLPERVTGSSLIFTLSAAAAADGRSVYLIGGAPGVPERAAEVLRERVPGLRVVGADSPPFGFDRTEQGTARIVDAVRAAAPDLVLVGLGFPRQERLIERLRDALPQAWYLGCGAAIAMAGGQFPRASPAMQRVGLEWAHRLRLEPRRLAGRYLRRDLPFALGLLAVAAGHRAVPRRHRRR